MLAPFYCYTDPCGGCAILCTTLYSECRLLSETRGEGLEVSKVTWCNVIRALFNAQKKDGDDAR